MSYDVIIEDVVILDQYSKMLEKFKQWVEFKRDIKISSLLDSGKKMRFDVEINSHGFDPIFGGLYDDNDVNDILSSACFLVKEMSFIINGIIVEKLSIKIQTLKTSNGEIVKNLIDSGIDFNIHQHIKDELVQYFYIKLSPIKLAA